MRAGHARGLRPPSASLRVGLLGAAVIRQAIEDATDPRLPRAVRQAAQTFLARGGPRLHLWCAVAGIDASAFRHVEG